MALAELLRLPAEGGKEDAKNDKEAVEWLLKAAKGCNHEAQFVLGRMYINGDRVSKNVVEGLKLLHEAAAYGELIAGYNFDGYADAQYFLGNLYSSGDGVPIDKSKAVEWYHAAAVQNHVRAQIHLGMMYADGDGVRQDYVHAHSWLSAASDEADEQAKAVLAKIVKQMTQEQIAEANELARKRLIPSADGLDWAG